MCGLKKPSDDSCSGDETMHGNGCYNDFEISRSESVKLTFSYNNPDDNQNLIETPCRYQGMYRVLCTRVNLMIEFLSMFDVLSAMT